MNEVLPERVADKQKLSCSNKLNMQHSIFKMEIIFQIYLSMKLLAFSDTDEYWAQNWDLFQIEGGRHTALSGYELVEN